MIASTILNRSISRFGECCLSRSHGTHLPMAPVGAEHPQRKWSARSLAFLGDSVWELYIRRSQFQSVIHLDQMHKTVSETVNAQTQACYYDKLLIGQFLNDSEREILRWGLNTKSTMFNRSKTTSVESYRKATALECLLGYLYLTDLPRLHALMQDLGWVHE